MKFVLSFFFTGDAALKSRLAQTDTTMGVRVLYGVYIAAATIVLVLIEYATGISMDPVGRYAGYLGLVFLLVGIYFGIKERRDTELGGFITYGQALGSGVLISLVAGLVTAVFTWIYLSQINPELLDYMKSQAGEAIRNNTQIPPDQRQKSLEMTQNFVTPTMQALFGIGGTLFFGFVFSLIISAFTKRVAGPLTDADLYNDDDAVVIE